MCSAEGCTNQARQQAGNSWRYDPTKRKLCSSEGCMHCAGGMVLGIRQR